jgi:hypothetical protein
MNKLADELKEIVGNYTDEFEILNFKREVKLYIQDIPSPLIYDIIVVSKSLNYGFIIKSCLTKYELKIEFYKTL